jgi:hypothetical protein
VYIEPPPPTVIIDQDIVVQDDPGVIYGEPGAAYGQPQGVQPGVIYGEPQPLEDGNVVPPPAAIAPDGAALAPDAPAPEGAAGGPRPPGAQSYEAGVEAFLASDYRKALTHFRVVTQLEPGNGEGWLARMHGAFVLARYDEAAKSLREAAELGAFPRGYRFDPRPMYSGKGTFERALLSLEEHARNNPAEIDAHVLLAYFHVALGNAERAQTEIAIVNSMRPSDPTATILTVAMLPPAPPPERMEDEGSEPLEDDGAIEPFPEPTPR